MDSSNQIGTKVQFKRLLVFILVLSGGCSTAQEKEQASKKVITKENVLVADAQDFHRALEGVMVTTKLKVTYDGMLAHSSANVYSLDNTNRWSVVISKDVGELTQSAAVELTGINIENGKKNYEMAVSIPKGFPEKERKALVDALKKLGTAKISGE